MRITLRVFLIRPFWIGGDDDDEDEEEDDVEVLFVVGIVFLFWSSPNACLR